MAMVAVLKVKNKKSGNEYKISAFKSYIIEQSLQIPADQFSFVLSNYNGEVSKAISAGDEVYFYLDNQLTFIGIIDEMTIRFGIQSMDVELSGRDKTSLLLDNECEPVTYKDLTLKSLIEKRASIYGIKTDIKDANNKIKKIVINGGETEWSIIENYTREVGIYGRFEKDTLVVSKLRKDSNIDYIFSNDNPGHIKIKDMLLTVSSDITTEVIVYADDNDKHKGIKGKATATGPNKRKKVMNEDVETNAAANKKAKEEIKKLNREAFAVMITTYTKKPLPINKVVRVVSKRLDLNIIMIIDKVRYTFDDGGSNTEITLKLIEGVSNKWSNHTIPTV